jgi:hypothetical protein
MVGGRRMIGEGGVDPLHADRAGPIEAEATQVPEHRVGGLVAHIELDRVTVRPSGRAGLNHQVLDPGGGGKLGGKLPGESGRAHHADVQHPSSPPVPPGAELR